MVLGAYRQILRNQGLTFSNIQTHIAELQAYQNAVFWIMKACQKYMNELQYVVYGAWGL